MALDLVTDPRGFFERKVGEPHIRTEIVLVLLIGALQLPGTLYVISQVLDEEASAEMRIAAAGWVIRPLLIMLLLWVGYSVIIHLISGHFGGRNPPGQIFKGAAWAFLPIGLGNLAQAAALFLIFRNADVGERLDGLTPAHRLEAVFESSMNEPLMMVAVLVFGLSILVSAYLLIWVVISAKELTREDALKVVAVPTIVHLAFVVWALVQGSINYGLVFTVVG